MFILTTEPGSNFKRFCATTIYLYNISFNLPKNIYVNLYLIGYVPAVFILQPVCSQSVYFSISGLVTTSGKSAQLERGWEGRLLETTNPGWEARLLEEFGVSAVWEGHLLDRSICGRGVH